MEIRKGRRTTNPWSQYSKKDFDLEKDVSLAANEFFQIAYTTAVSRVHLVQEGRTILLFDYHSAVENLDERIQRITTFLNSLQLGKIGAAAQDDFFLFLEETQAENDASIDHKMLATLQVDD